MYGALEYRSYQAQSGIEEYGITITGPGEAYSYVYDSKDIDLFKISYDFEFTTSNQIDPELRNELFQVVQEWKRRHQSDDLPYMMFTKSMNFVTVYDGRSIENSIKKNFEGPPAWTIVFCNESPKTINQIKKHFLELEILTMSFRVKCCNIVNMIHIGICPQAKLFESNRAS